jgi:hypothetical protein
MNRKGIMRNATTDETMFQAEPAILVCEETKPWLISAQETIPDDLNLEDLSASSLPADGWGINE